MLLVAGLVSGAAGQPLDTAENVAKKTAEKTKEAAQTVAHGVKKAANKVEDALTPDPDARRVDVTVNDGEVNMSSDLEPGKTAFVVKNEGKTTTNFQITGGNIDRKFVTPPGPGETKVLHVTLKRGAHYTVSQAAPFPRYNYPLLVATPGERVDIRVFRILSGINALSNKQRWNNATDR